VAISKLEFDELNEGEADLFSGVLSLVNTTGTVTWNCVVGGLANNSTYKIFNGSRGNVERINSFYLSGNAYDEFLPGICAKMTGLRKFAVVGENVSEQVLNEILLATSGIETVDFTRTSILRRSTASALCAQHGETLKVLVISFASVSTDHLQLIACHCRQLTCLIMDSLEHISRDTLNAIAQGCTKLQHVEIACPHQVSSSVLTKFAQRCTDLQSLWLDGSRTKLTDEVLLVMSTSCLVLENLGGFTWEIRALASVEAAKTLLGRLTSFTVSCGPPNTATTMQKGLGYLRSCTRLSLTGIAAAHANVLRCCGTTGIGYISIELRGAEGAQVSQDDFLLAAAATSPLLDSIRVTGTCKVEGSTLLTVLARCPMLRTIVATVDATEAVMLEIVQHSYLVGMMTINNSAGFTDAVVRAIARCCPHLRMLNLTAATQVTEDAAMELVRSGGKRRSSLFVRLSPTFDPAAQDRLRSAALEGRTSITFF
jgi:hypothetical protein